jgi:serine/threonine protein kinase/tetratricopeptide (TPR) repeat protein
MHADRKQSEPKATGRGSDPSLPTESYRGTSDGPGTRIGPYKLLQQIGEGGFGVVYMAEQDQPVHRRVALKIIKPGMDSAQVIARFEAERQALALMDHQNIAKVYDAGTTDIGRPYFVMELVHGVPMTKYCDDNHLTVRERLELFMPVCKAVQHAHQKGIIHRDLKPSNVLVCLYDGQPVPKVIDFGVAKATEQRLTERTMYTQYGQIIGTFEYMSPEQAEMSQLGVDTRSDIYSLGVMLYELLTGSTPLQRQRLREAGLSDMLKMVKEEEPPKPSTRLSSTQEAAKIAAARRSEPVKLTKLLRGELDWVVMKCLEKDRARRYESANGLARDIERYLHEEPVEAGPPGASYRLRRLARKHRTGFAIVATFAGLFLLAGALCAWQAVRATKAEHKALDERDRAEQARVAEEQAATRKRQAREAAEANLRLARKAVDRGFTRVSQLPELKGLALEGLRHNLLREAKEFYEQMVQQQPDEPSLQAERARIYLKLAETTEDLDDRPRAVEYAGQARDIFALLGKNHPTIGEYQDGLARALTSVGRNYRALNQVQQAQEALERSLELRQQLLAANSQARDYRFQLALTFNQLGLLYINGLNKLSEGVRALENAKALCEQLLKESPNEPEYVNELAQTFINLMMRANFTDQYEQAVRDGERAAGLLEQLTRAHPRVADYQYWLAFSWSNVAYAQEMCHHPEQALATCVKALRIAERLVHAHPDIPTYRNRVAHIQINHATTLAHQGEFRQAAAEVGSAESDASLGVTIYNGACVYCQCARAVRKNDTLSLAEKDLLAGQYLDRAMNLLRRAKAAREHFNSAQGVRQLKTDSDLDPLRSREDFREFIAQVEQQAGERK